MHTKDTKPHSQTITHEEYTLPTIPMYMVVNSLMQINEEIQRLIDNFAPS